MASVDPHETLTVKSEEQSLSLEAMQMQQAQFSREVFHGLFEFYKIRTKFAKWIRGSNYQFTTYNVNEAIIVLSYIYRPVFRKFFRKVIPQEMSAPAFERIVTAYSVPRVEEYFLSFLVWIGYVIDFTILCYINGKDYIEFAIQCLSKYPDTQYFHSQGGWQELYKLCEPFPDVFHVLFAVVLAETPQLKDVYPFFYYVNKSISRQDREHVGWYSPSGRFIVKKYRELMKQYNLDLHLDLSCLTDRSESRQENSPNSIPQTPLLSPSQAFSETSSWKCSGYKSPQSNSTLSSPVTLSPTSVMSERLLEVHEKQFVDTVKALRIDGVEAMTQFTKRLGNILASAEANLAKEIPSVNSTEIDLETEKELPMVTRELCECLIKIRLEQEMKAGVSWSKLAAKASDRIKCSESKSGVQAKVARSSESAEACSSAGATQIQNCAIIPTKLSFLQLDSDPQGSDVQTSNENARNEQKQSKSKKKKRSRRSKNKRKK